jgi:hypothetical protein
MASWKFTMADRTTHSATYEARLLALGFIREEQPDGSFKWYVIHPQSGERVEIDPEQAWFWTEEWQAKEREADKDLREGRYEEFDNLDDFINSL